MVSTKQFDVFTAGIRHQVFGSILLNRNKPAMRSRRRW
jgi:hypothetical protein